MLYICGRNTSLQLDETSNNRNMNGEKIISPLIQSSIDQSLISSYSTYDDHTVIITKKGEMFAIGPNIDKRIYKISSKQKFDKLTKFEIKDKHNETFYPISAVCCSKYTLYLVSKSKDSRENQLVLSNQKFLINNGKSYPVSLFGGFKNSASIDSEGSIIVISNPRNDKFDLSFKRLQSSDKATSVACCDDFIFAVGSSGKVYMASPGSDFKIVEELKGTKIVDVSGTHNHCFAISEEGKVFGFGSNKYGELGIGNKEIIDDKFIEISSLKKYKIKSAYAGFDHSLFLTDNGKILACGSNWYGQLLDDEPTEECIYLPFETKITKNAKFCVAGFGSSSIFVGIDPPNSPNKVLSYKKTAQDASQQQQQKQLEQNTQQAHQQSQLPKLHIQLKQPKIVQQTAQPTPTPSGSAETLDRLMKAEDEILHLQRENLRLRNENEILRQRVKLLESNKDIEPKKSSLDLDLFDTKMIDNLKRVKIIGRGNSSEVFEVSREQKLALKVFSVDDDDNNNTTNEETKNNSSSPKSNSLVSLQKMKHDFEVMLAHNHNNLVQTYGVCYGDESHLPSLLLQFYPHNLNNIVKNMSNKERVCAIFEISLGMEAVHAAGLIHKDLKPENILFDEKGHVKVSDYALSSIFGSKMKILKSDSESSKFMAPELLNENQKYDKKADVYSFGTVAFYILTGGEMPKISTAEIAAGKKAPIPDTINKISKDMLNRCWMTAAKERPSFTDIVKFIKGNKFKLIDGVERNFTDIKSFLSIQ